jgi:hypothetical protein
MQIGIDSSQYLQNSHLQFLSRSSLIIQIQIGTDVNNYSSPHWDAQQKYCSSHCSLVGRFSSGVTLSSSSTCRCRSSPARLTIVAKRGSAPRSPGASVRWCCGTCCDVCCVACVGLGLPLEELMSGKRC